MSEKLIGEIERKLNTKTIHDLRQIARAVGVPRPADGRKERIIKCIVEIAAGVSDPAAPAIRGAHPKSSEYDRQLVTDILRCREISLFNEDSEEQRFTLGVASGDDDPFDYRSGGVLESSDGKWFLRVNPDTDGIRGDIFVNEYFVNSFGLREGDFVQGRCKRNSPDELAGLAEVHSVNGLSPTGLVRRSFDKLTPVYPHCRLKTSLGANDVQGRAVDLISPLGAGQRAAVIAAHGTGKTSVLKNMACGISANNSDVKIIFLLIDARPEEVSDVRRSLPSADMFVSHMDAGTAGHIGKANLALEYAKRIVEAGRDAVLIIDDLTKLVRAYNSTLNVFNTLNSAALDEVKKIIAAARCFEEGGSLTVLTALCSDEDGEFERSAYCALKDVFGMKITLSSSLARMRIYPPLELSETYSIGDERLLSAEELKAAVKLRGCSVEEISRLMESSDTERELCKNLLR